MSAPNDAALRIVRAGPLVSVQDRGRHGFRRYGVSVSGPMDWVAHALALKLAGCAPDDPAFEVGPGGLTVEAEGAPVRLGVAGTGHRAEIERRGRPRAVVPAPARIVLEPGERLSLRAGGEGVWGTLAATDLDAGEAVLGSRATNMRTGLGPPRPDAGARYACAAAEPVPPLPFRDPLEGVVGPIRALPGPQHHLFPPETWAAFTSDAYAVTPQTDRMAYRLEGPALKAVTHDIVSDALVEGAMQVPGDGQPLVLCADRAPTGGYPKIAVIARADLPRLVQMRPGARFRFSWIDEDEAREATAALSRAIEDAEPRRRTPLPGAFMASLAKRRR